MHEQFNQHAEEDPFDLNRFVEAQADTYKRALTELKHGRKRSHWMWFIFPQIDGLGRSSTTIFYAIRGTDEAKAYLNHPLLGPRLVECCNALLQMTGKSPSEIFGWPDEMKLRSSMTLFASVSEPGSVFARVLDQYFRGEFDQRTIELLQQKSSR